MSADKLVLSGDYWIKTPTAGEIRLDTGVSTGTVVITGNLNVLGIQTTIESIDAKIKDTIIVLNNGEPNSSNIAEGTVSWDDHKAGISIDRGSNNDQGLAATFLWDNEKYWITTTRTSKGLWTLRNNARPSALEIGALKFLGEDAGQEGNYIILDGLHPLIITDPNDDYYSKVVNSLDPNTIPNKKYVDQKYNVATTATTAREIRVGNSSVTISDYTETGQQSFITASLNSSSVFVIRPTEVLFSTVRIGNSTIESLSSNTDLTLLTNGTGVIAVNNGVAFQAPVFPSWHPPTPAVSKVNVYSSSTVGAGQTGLLFNYESAQGRQIYGELVSAKKAIVLGIIF